MDTDRIAPDSGQRPGDVAPPLPGEAEAAPAPAWEQLENGRYRPRRIRGSLRGRELG